MESFTKIYMYFACKTESEMFYSPRQRWIPFRNCFGRDWKKWVSMRNGFLKYSFWLHGISSPLGWPTSDIGSFGVICDNIKIRKVRSSSMEYFTEWFWYPSYSFLGWKMFVCHGLNTRNKFKLLPSHYCYSVVIYHLKRNSLKKRG